MDRAKVTVEYIQTFLIEDFDCQNLDWKKQMMKMNGDGLVDSLAFDHQRETVRVVNVEYLDDEG